MNKRTDVSGPTGQQKESSLFNAQVRMMYATANPGVMHTLLVLIVGWMYWGVADQGSLLLWLGAMLTVSLGRFAMVQVFVAREPGDEEIEWWDRAYLIALFVNGVIWGAAGFLLYPPDNTIYQVVLAFVIGGMSASATASLAARQAAIVLAVCPAMLIASVRFLFDGTEGHIEMGVILLLYLAVLMNIGRAMHRQIIDSLSLRFENQALVESLENSVSELEVARGIAEQSNRAKTRFLASASHDLRQPVHAMTLFVSALMRRLVEDQNSQDLIAKINRSLDSVRGLLDSLLDISKLDAGIVHVREERIELRVLLDQVVNEFAGLAEEKSLYLRAAGPTAFVESDLVLLGQIVRNLTANAIRYTKSGGVLIAVRKSGDTARVEIWDTGVGIRTEDQEEIFQEFFQLRNVSTDQQGGLGLGLSIVKRTCDLLNCKMELMSELGKGSRFVVTLPLAADQEQHASQLDMHAPDMSVGQEASHVLLIEDDPLSADALKGLLESWGYKCALTDGLAGLADAIGSLGNRVDLIISDYRLADGETGDYVAREVRSKVGENTPVLIVTGDTGPDRLLDLRETGLDLLHKPVQPAELRAIVRHLLTPNAD
ncbi:MAG: ATP-binding protein [Parvibaculaceae bacterium]|nr:ATP-binding protein [Parvibaculaceae bacterium]HBM87177.1 hybrid sensor histidine kinase/response regulator [Rhodobiaceae bacterium]